MNDFPEYLAGDGKTDGMRRVLFPLKDRLEMAAIWAAPASLLSFALTCDYAGSTPLEGGSHFDERKWNIVLDRDRCEGVFRCWEVCPEACFEKLEEPRKVVLEHDDRFIRCGACVVQCPKDALFFQDADGARIEPEVLRRFKLNLLGERTIGAD